MGNLVSHKKEGRHAAPPGSWIIRFCPPHTAKKFLKNHSTMPTFHWPCPEWITGQLFHKLMFMVVQMYLEGDIAVITRLVQQPLTAVELVDQYNTVLESAGEGFIELEKELLELAHEYIYIFVENEQLCYLDLIVTSNFDPYNGLRNILNCTKLGNSQAARSSQSSESKYKKRKHAETTVHPVPPCVSHMQSTPPLGHNEPNIGLHHNSTDAKEGQSFKQNHNNQNSSHSNFEKENAISEDENQSTASTGQKKEENHAKSKTRKLDTESSLYPIPPYAIQIVPSAPSFESIEDYGSQSADCTDTKENDADESSMEESHVNDEDGISIPKSENLFTTLNEQKNKSQNKCKNNEQDSETTVFPESRIPPYAVRVVPSGLFEKGGGSNDTGTKRSVSVESSKGNDDQNGDHEENCKNTNGVVELAANNKYTEGKHLAPTRRTTRFTSIFPIHGLSRNILSPCCSKDIDESEQHRAGENVWKETQKNETEPQKLSRSRVLPIHGLSRCVFRSPSKSSSKSESDSINGKEPQTKDGGKKNDIFGTPQEREIDKTNAEHSDFEREGHNVTRTQDIENRGGDDHDESSHNMSSNNESLTAWGTTSEDEDSSSEMVQWYDALD